jgi:rfaE bifunctional protein kinase chain/domain
MPARSAANILSAIAGKRALVIGDICLDRWCDYDPALGEPSRETGLTRVAVVRTAITAGAGGTVANNLAALGARVSVLGALGDDGHGYELRQALDRGGIAHDLMVVTGEPTFTYTKLLNASSGDEDLGRIDYLAPALNRAEEQAIVARLRDAAAGFDCILVSDQAETETPGVVTAAVREELSRLANADPSRIIWVDSRMRAEQFRNVLVKPNEREAREACVRAGLSETDFRGLRDLIGHERLIVTHGPQGVLLLDGAHESWVATRAVEKPVDICGAGDSFSAGAALALCAGASLRDAARFANCVTAVTIMKKGTGTASPDEVLRAERELPA